MRHRVGVASSAVAFVRSASATSSKPVRTASVSARTTRAPVIRGMKSSGIEASTVTALDATTTSSAVISHSRDMALKVLVSARWPISTPFGVPVDPDVKST